MRKQRNNHRRSNHNNGQQPHNLKPTAHKRSRTNSSKRSNNRRNHPIRYRELEPVRVSSSSIHNNWKTELGGIIRYYVNTKEDANEAMKSIERMYFTSACDVQETKEKILADLGATRARTNSSEWIDISMAIEKDGGVNNTLLLDDEVLRSHESTFHDDGLKLKNQIKSGEGPAHSHEKWTHVIVPSWAIGKSYFFQMTNNSPLNLSCEMTIDDHKVARNVPIPGNSTRYVRPDNARYFQTHKWVIQPARKVSLQDAITLRVQQQQRNQSSSSSSSGVRIKVEDNNPLQKFGKRFNNIHPNYNGQRVSMNEYPDPSAYGWTFTGSSETSRVEFFEKNVNLGIVKLDFYYTTATLKTTLVHPSTGRNCLFRNTVTPDIYVQILMNPRSHTSRGYRSKSDRPPDNTDLPMMEESDDDDENHEEVNGDNMTDMALDDG